MIRLKFPYRLWCWRQRRWGFKYKLKLIFVTCTAVILLFHLLISYFRRPLTRLLRQDELSNYFVTGNVGEDYYNKLGYIVNTSQCRILDIDPWDPLIKAYHTRNLKPPVDCGNQRQWTYVNRTTVVLNETAVQESGYVFAHIYCCYRSILKDPRLFNKATGWYSPLVDSRVVYSATCTPLQLVTEPDAEYIFVTCKPKNFYWYLDERLLSNVVYKNFHALVPRRKQDAVQKKSQHWKHTNNRMLSSPNNRSPNVVLLGMDTVSRLNFRRNAPKTIKILTAIGAHEMFGFTRVGENTMNNLVAFLMGYTEADLKRACWYTDVTKLDLCPFIWKRFSAANYVTAEIQDSATYNNWNYDKTGFVESPTDYDLRRHLVGIHWNAGYYPRNVECVGRLRMQDMLLAYLKDIIEYTQASETPLFMTSWFTQLTHDSPGALQFGESSYAGFLEHLSTTGFLDNTILIVAADHGPRYGNIRETLPGYYENGLANLWIRLPPWIIKKYPEWEAALIHNSRMLSSGFNIYKTFNQILDTFSNTSEIEGRAIDGSLIPRIYGRSFFKNISEDATCKSSGIPESFCVCQKPEGIPQSSEVLRTAARASIEYLNRVLPSQCSRLSLLRIKGGAIIKMTNLENERHLKRTKIIVEFITDPGEFLLEATVIGLKHRGKAEIKYEVEEDIQRLSKFTTDVNCVKNAKMRLYCFC